MPHSDPVVERLIYMGRTFRPHMRRRRGFIDVVPMTDAVLLLFVFFITQSSFVLQPGIRLELPPSSFQAGADYGSLVVTVSQEGMVFFNDERTTLDGLAPDFSRAAHEEPDSPLVIEADGRVRHSSLVQIYNMAQEAGINVIYLANRLERPVIPPVP